MALDVIVLNNLGGGMSVRVDKLPRPGETVRGHDWKANIDAGKGPNSCICMGRLGIRPAFIGKAGKDAAGDRGENWMKEAGVDTSGLLRTDEVMTGQGIRVIEDSGQNLIVTGESSSRALTPEEVCRELERLAPAQFFSTGFEIREELTLAGLKKAKELGMTTVLNYSPIPKTPLAPLPCVDFLVINEVEAARILGLADWHELPLAQLVEEVKKLFQCANVIMTLGADGCCGLTADGFFTRPTQPVQVVDTTGAGDAFLSAMIVCLVKGLTVPDACAWASRFASYTTTRWGTIPAYPTMDELAQALGDSVRL
ncbi:MAG: ribokinase [Pygmaiobacter massiliensis]|nr:ribokinase [Pygmaiobacter massiliensis]